MTRILCPIDLSDISGHVLDHASALAQGYGAQLTVLHVVANAPAMNVPAPALDQVERDRLVRAMRKAAAGVPATVAPEFLVREADSSYRGIFEQIVESRPDFLVLGTHGRAAFQRLFLGSVVEQVIRTASCPTLVVPPRAGDISTRPVQFRHIVCAVDFSAGSLMALKQALCLSQQTASQLTLLHVIEKPAELRETAPATEDHVARIRTAAEAGALRRLRALVPLQSQIPTAMTMVVEEGRAYCEVLRKATEVDADLIVMGVHDRGALGSIELGSTTHHVIGEARRPVLIVRSL